MMACWQCLLLSCLSFIRSKDKGIVPYKDLSSRETMDAIQSHLQRKGNVKSQQMSSTLE